MGGLTVGAALVARFGIRVERFLFAYAAAELTVAASGVLITYLLPGLTDLAANLAVTETQTWPVNTSRFIAGFFVLVIPATAMGATMPLLTAALDQAGRGFGTALGWVYGWNTLGAVAGALGAELLLVPSVGVAGSAWVAAALCLAAGASAWLLEARRSPSRTHRARLAAGSRPIAATARSCAAAGRVFPLGRHAARPRSRVVPLPHHVRAVHDAGRHGDAGGRARVDWNRRPDRVDVARAVAGRVAPRPRARVRGRSRRGVVCTRVFSSRRGRRLRSGSERSGSRAC